VNTETLRCYERRGLLTEPPRPTGGYRDFPPTTVELLRHSLAGLVATWDLPRGDRSCALLEAIDDRLEATR
jgi:hypothetical protein